MSNIINKTCTCCNVVQPISEFYKSNKNKDGFLYICKICSKIKSIKYAKNNLEIIKNIRIEYNKKHKIKILYDAKQFYLENKQYFRDYNKKKYKEDINYKISHNFRTRMWELLKITKTSKTTSILNLLGNNINEVKLYLEKQFKPEMTWLNHGKVWEIDHIKPCSSFNLVELEEQQKCFHYTNLQPLFKTTSIAKSFGYFNEIGNKEKGGKYV